MSDTLLEKPTLKTPQREAGCSAPPCSHLRDGEKTSDIICEAKLELLDVLEELGEAAGLLREAYGNHGNGNVPGAEMCVGDVVEIMGTVERKSSEIAASLAKWVDY